LSRAVVQLPTAYESKLYLPQEATGQYLFQQQHQKPLKTDQQSKIPKAIQHIFAKTNI